MQGSDWPLLAASGLELEAGRLSRFGAKVPTTADRH